MKLVVYGPDRRLGALQGEQVIDINGAQAKYLKERENEPLPYEMATAVVPPDLDRFILSGQRGIHAADTAVAYVLGKAVDQQGPKGERLVQPRADVKLHAPYPTRTRIMMGGGNFIVHSAGMGHRKPDGTTMSLEEIYAESRKKGIWGFYCFPENVAGPDEEVIYPTRTDRLDYEGEVAVIIGKRGKDIKASEGKDYIWGYTLQNDVSARTTIPARDHPQSTFNRGKNFDTSICAGPCIVVNEIPDPHNVTWETRVNGEVRQSGNTKDMTFNFFEYLEYMSSDMTLIPGDIISAGTTAGTAQDSSPLMPGTGGEGVPAMRDPARFLKPGDIVEISNPLIGVLRNRVVAKSDL